MGIDLSGIWSDWMAAAAIGVVAVSTLMLGLCSLCGLCRAGDRLLRRRRIALRPHRTGTM